MIVLLWGPDDYRREEKRRELVGAFYAKYPHARVSRIPLGTPEGVDALKDFLGSQSLFGGARLALVDDAYEGDTKPVKALLASIAASPDATLIISERTKPPKPMAFLVGSKKKKEILDQEFSLLRGAAWTAFVKEEAKKRGAKLSDTSLAAVAVRFAGDSWGVVTELEKLSLLEKPPSAEELRGLNPELRMDFWGLVNGIRSASLASRMRALCALEAMGEPDAKTFAILAASARTGKRIYAHLDTQVKSGALEYEEVMLDLALTFER